MRVLLGALVLVVGTRASADRPPRSPRPPAVPLVPGARPPKTPSLPSHPSFTTTIDENGHLEFHEECRYEMVGELLALVMLEPASIPKEYAGDNEKLHIRRLSFARRARLKETADRERRHVAVYNVSSKLWAIWKQTSWSPERRRRLLFETWDDCAEDAEGLIARANVLGFIRRHLPAGSASSYTGEELVRLNSLRTSATQFEPYRTP